MKSIVYLLLIEIGLLSLGGSSSSLTIAFVTSTKRSNNHDLQPLQRLYSESSSSSNLVRLQQRFNLKEDWTKKPFLVSLDKIKYTIILSRIDWLKERLKLSEDDVAIIIRRHPLILSYRSDEKVAPILEFLTDQLDLQPKELSRLVKRIPSILGLRLENMQQNLNWIKKRIVLYNSSNKSLSQNKKVLKRIIHHAPTLLIYNIENNLEPKWDMLREVLDLNEHRMAKIIIKFPILLVLSLTATLEPKLNWCQNYLELDRKELSKIIQKAPQILGLDVENCLKPKILWLKRRLLLDKSSIKKTIIKFPSILNYSTTTKMEPILQWLEERCILEAPQQLGKLIEIFPQIFGMSIENNLDPTFEFFQDCVGEEDAVKLIQNNPIFLGYSLEKRLKPRYEQAKQAGIDINVGCVQRMAILTDEKWHVSLKYQQKRVLSN